LYRRVVQAFAHVLPVARRCEVYKVVEVVFVLALFVPYGVVGFPKFALWRGDESFSASGPTPRPAFNVGGVPVGPNVLLRATTNELARAQEHVLLMSKSAKCRAATFLTDLWVRLGKAQYLDVPMSHQDIADYLGLTTETLSRSITDMERSGLIARVASQRRLLLQNHFRLRRVMLN
jgi:DNA-binding MarR family transcriptional regulator